MSEEKNNKADVKEKTEQISIPETQPEPPNMETQAHHLHKAPSHGWRHYLFEFLMLFLAVFAGFVAENWREEAINRKSEKKFIASLVRDLQIDTSNLNGLIKWREKRNFVFDSLISLLHDPDPQSKSALIYKYGWVGYTINNFIPDDQTYQNIKSSGSLRIIHSLEVSDSIGQYYAEIDKGKEYSEPFSRAIILQFRTVANEVLDGRVLHQLNLEMDTTDMFSLPLPANAKLITTDAKLLNKLSVETVSLYLNNNGTLDRYRSLKLEAENLIVFLKKEYHIK